MKYIPKNGIEERLQNLETQFNLEKPIPVNIYKRLKLLEDRLLYLESISPEYIHFWVKIVSHIYYSVFNDFFFSKKAVLFINLSRKEYFQWKKLVVL